MFSFECLLENWSGLFLFYRSDYRLSFRIANNWFILITSAFNDDENNTNKTHLLNSFCLDRFLVMSDQIFISSIGSSLFDTYLVYGIIGLLLAIAFVGVIVLLATACCCSNCYSSARAFCCLNCYRHSLRHSTYRLSQESNHQKRVVQRDKTKLACIKRNTSDVANFSQLYESCPHLINNKAMTTKPQNTNSNMESSCTTIDTIISPISPCSSFRSFATPIPSATPIKSNLDLFLFRKKKTSSFRDFWTRVGFSCI